MSKENPYQDPVLRAALRPEFQRNDFDPNDYELVNGYPLKKSRFNQLCTNLASALYGGRTWSMVALKRHLGAAVSWFTSFEQIERWEETAKNPIRSWIGEREHFFIVSNWLDAYLLENSMMVSCGVEQDHFAVDVILKDGTLLAHVWVAAAKLPKISKDTKTPYLVTEASSLVWNAFGLTHIIPLEQVISFRFHDNRDENKLPFLCRFTQQNLRDDLARQLEAETSYESMTPPTEINFLSE